ncbi:DUF4184 family protein [Streptomyces sp. H27-H1]|uniref:DUF4184 family protein n=1 Tax=Streptomyces sp. H27-H1 TaxID=2996461 RepID=UPI00226D9DDF|nr:DUF4184 family protein [Streptomyces sp. H27-H1]MCY0932128.1 DUF4184 family protein [Streptomyces sp. H27-H1]
MPFTLSHPAAVLVVARHPLVVPALVAGSMAPDVPDFIGINAGRPVWWEPFFNLTYTHSLPGIGIDLIYALVLVALFLLVKRPVLAMAPKVATRVPEPLGYGPGAAGVARRTLWTLVSALIGVITHLIWDSVTHYGMFFDEHFSFMRTPVIGGLDVLRLMQHVSSVIGLVAIGFWLWRKWRGATAMPLSSSLILGNRMRLAVVVGLVVAGSMGAVQRVLETNYTVATEAVLRQVATGSGLGIALGLIVYSLAWQAAHFKKLQRHATEEPCKVKADSHRAS